MKKKSSKGATAKPAVKRAAPAPSAGAGAGGPIHVQEHSKPPVEVQEHSAPQISVQEHRHHGRQQH